MFQTAHGRRVWRFDSEQRALIFRRQLLQDEPGVVFATLCPSTKHRVIAYHEVSRGALDATLVHPREVFKAARLSNATSIILTHNHPSGDPHPALTTTS